LIKTVLNCKFKTKILGAFALFLGLQVSLFSTSLFAQKQQFTVVLDAGHGGGDPGNIGNGYREKNITLKVVLELGKILAKEDFINVKYTRTKDVAVDLWERGNIANDFKADLFVSVHCNSHKSAAFGTESFVLGLGAIDRNFKVAKDFVKKENAVIYKEKNYKERYKWFDPNSAESVIELSLMQEENLDKSLALASSIQTNFRSKLKRKDRGVKQAKFVVLYQTYMPSVLVELGFLTNKNEGKYLNSKKGQQQLAKQIASAIVKYLSRLRLNTIATDDVVTVEETPDTDVPKVDETETKEDVLFKIQIASSKKKIRTKSYNFKGLKNVERVKVGKYYKYYYGHSSDYQETKRALAKAKKKGYKSAFIAAFLNGEKVSLSKVLK
jgi:N-acetylmuramoyl-L-alanine amidase